MAIMQTFRDVIEALGGTAAVAVALGIPESHARVMKSRSSIPAERWQEVVATAKKLGRADIDYETLIKLARRKPTPSRKRKDAA